ncbi:hypothetical protein [Moorena producens]
MRYKKTFHILPVMNLLIPAPCSLLPKPKVVPDQLKNRYNE